MLRSARIFILHCCLTAVLAAQGTQPVLFSASGLSAQDRLAVLAIAGIVNRDSARLYLQNVYETWSYSSTDERWVQEYVGKGKVQFRTPVVTSLASLVDLFRDDLQGAITYDGGRTFSNFSGQSFLWQGEFATLIGGLTNRVPCTVAMASQLGLAIADSVLIEDAFDGDSAVWVPGRIEDSLNAWNHSSLLTEENRYLALCDWGIRVLLPRCNPGRAYLREITDFTVRHQMFQLNLAGTDDLDFNSLPSPRAELIERMLQFMQGRNLGRVWHLYGWMRPEPLIQWFAHYGASFHETLLGNLSWHSSFKWPKPDVYQRASTVQADTIPVQSKYYVVFITSEGDASNWVFSFQSGAWLSTNRGRAPIGWGMNLHLLDECPFVASYYYDSATRNDGIVSVTSPLGYAYPDTWWGLASKQGAIDSTRALMDRFQVGEVYGYKHYASTGYTSYRGKDIYNSFNFTNYGAFQQATDAALTMVYDPAIPARVPVTTYGTLMYNHVGDGSFYGDVTSISAAKTRIVNTLKTMSRPSFLIGGYQRFRQDGFTGGGTADISVARLMQLIDSLKADPTVGPYVEVVTPEVFSVVMRKQTGILDVDRIGELPDEFMLTQNYPNPFNPMTIVDYRLSIGGTVRLSVSDMLGREVAVLVDGWQNSGTYQVPFDGSRLSSGTYFARLTAGGMMSTIRMMLIK